MNTPTLPRQADTILTHLRSRGSITPLEALHLYRVPHLAFPIHQIRKAGIPVPKDMRKDLTGKRYAHYTLTGVVA